MSLIAEEFKTIKVPSRLFLASMLCILVAISVSSYFLDGARAIAFGLIPAMTLLILSRNVGISRKKTPALNAMSWFLAATIYAAAMFWVALNPS